MLDVLNGKIASLGLGSVHTRLVDLTDGGVLEGQFDLIVSGMTLHHIEDTAGLLSSFHHVLKTGGYLCIADLDTEKGLFHDNDAGVFHDGFDRGALLSVFKEAGYSDTHCTTAAVTRKKNRDGVEQDFTVFLMTGRK
jgi:SAM-dependent methyltransferase